MASNTKLNTVLGKAKQLRGILRELDQTSGTKLAWTADTQSEVAEFFGVSIDTVKNWAKQRMPGKPRNYRLDLIAIWLRTEGPGSKALRADDDPMLAGDSPALERYRLAKALLAELDLKEREKTLIPRDKAREALGRWAAVIRRFGERLGKRYGQEASIALNDALSECEQISNEFSSGSTGN